MENLLNVKAKDFEKYINLDGYELVENEDNSFIKTIILVNTENNALTAEIDEFNSSLTNHMFRTLVFKENGVANRDNGPAKIEFMDGKIVEVGYSKNGVGFAGLNVPSRIRFYENGDVKEIAYSNSNQKLSRTNGPAVVTYLLDGTVENGFYINGEKFTQKQYENIISSVNSKGYLRSLSRAKLPRLLIIRQVLKENGIIDEALEAKIVVLKLEEV